VYSDARLRLSIKSVFTKAKTDVCLAMLRAMRRGIISTSVPGRTIRHRENNEHNDEDEEKCMVHYVLLWESPGSGRPGLTQSGGGRSALNGGAAISTNHFARSAQRTISHCSPVPVIHC